MYHGVLCIMAVVVVADEDEDEELVGLLLEYCMPAIALPKIVQAESRLLEVAVQVQLYAVGLCLVVRLIVQCLLFGVQPSLLNLLREPSTVVHPPASKLFDRVVEQAVEVE